MDNSGAKPEVERGKAAFARLIELAKLGRKDILPVLKRLLDGHPELWKHYGNLARQAQANWLDLIGQKNLYLKECLERQTAEMRATLAGADASPLEQLQAERIAALNLQLGYYEAQVARYESLKPDKVMEYLQRQCSSTDRRLQSAISNLARIRKLLPQTVKVEVTLSGEVQTSAKNPQPNSQTPTNGAEPMHVRIPANRIKDILAAANN